MYIPLYTLYTFISGPLHVFLAASYYHQSKAARHVNNLVRILPRMLAGRKNVILLSDNGPDWNGKACYILVGWDGFVLFLVCCYILISLLCSALLSVVTFLPAVKLSIS